MNERGPRQEVHSPAAREQATSLVRRNALTRLRRIEGQVRGLQRMIEEERDCADVLTQVASVHQALRSTERLLLRAELRDRVRDAFGSGDVDRMEEAAAEVFDLAERRGS